MTLADERKRWEGVRLFPDRPEHDCHCRDLGREEMVTFLDSANVVHGYYCRRCQGHLRFTTEGRRKGPDES